MGSDSAGDSEKTGLQHAHFGKWHLGYTQERLPSTRGFDECYGLPRTFYFTTTVGYDPEQGQRSYLMEGKVGEDSIYLGEFNMDGRRYIGGEVVEHSKDFMQRNVAYGKPFFLYAPITQMHFPNLPHPDFIGKTGYGDMADPLAEMDHRVGQLVDEVEC